MFVVVFLRDANCYTVVPEEFILDVNEKTVKNYGINRNQHRRIFFSKEWFENQVIKVNLEQQFVPNFDLPYTAVYPLPIHMGETCYIGRMIKFEDNFEAAMQKVERNRPQMPAIYNEARVNERPVPRAELSADEINGQSDEEREELQSTFFDSAELSADEINEQRDEDNDDLQSTFFDSVELDAVEEDIKPVIGDEDLAALNGLFEEPDSNQRDPLAVDDSEQGNVESNGPSIDLSRGTASFINEIEHESTRIDAVENSIPNGLSHELSEANIENEEANVEREREIAQNARRVLLYGRKVVFDEDVEYISIPNQKLQPIKDEPKYQVKNNDLISGKKAFKEYVIFSFTFSYHSNIG